MTHSFSEHFSSLNLDAQHFLIVVATNLELEAVFRESKFQDQAPVHLIDGGFKTILYKSNTYTFLVCGVGPLNASFYLGKFLGQFTNAFKDSKINFNLIINFGIAGSYDLTLLPLGSVILANSELFPEYGLRLDKLADPKALGFPLFREVPLQSACNPDLALTEQIVWNKLNFLSEKDLQDLALKVNLSCLSLIKKGLGISVAGVSGSFERAEELKKEYAQTKDELLFENMEGFSLGLASLQQKIPFLELRTISNLVGSRKKDDWNIALALQTLSSVAKKILWY
ncbi:futalosine hydrolase [Desulfovibrio litoralis]|uniref:Futalosine hydrolase n=1 Tax=Desulfovibrio litoralis DSM 11393 TaxID=1121455 RepID=A0A1M7RWF8_9BACT|nr:futalosine hydrolase [Desulfovibrio litoralis]SHN50516.1 futalosine hydrolase [Desulfovibrio litoralis DSM 11393]